MSITFSFSSPPSKLSLTVLSLLQIPHLGDHHHNLPLLTLLPLKVLSVTLSLLAHWPPQTTHSNISSSIWLLVWLLVTHPLLSSSLCNIPIPFLSPLPLPNFFFFPLCETPHTSSRLSCYHPLLFSPIPWSLFRFQTPFGWSIGLSLANDSEVVWTVVDSLLEGQLPHIPLIYSSLHWLMERGVTGQPFIVEEARAENK